MKVISFTAIQELQISPSQCYEWVSMCISKKKEMQLPAKIHMNMEGNVFCNVMPSVVPFNGKRWGGVKIVTRYPQRTPALDSKLLLFDAETGQFFALMDANWITAMRTGAVAAHSILHLAKSEFQTIGIIGLGNTARASLLCLTDQLRRQVSVKLLRYKDQAGQYIERFADDPNLRFSVVENAEKLVQGSDVVVSCATFFDHDICDDSCFDEGVLVVPVHTRGFTNCDLFFDKVFADDTAHVSDFRFFSRFRSFAEISDVINGTAPGRENDRERILAYNIGLSIHDVFFAANIYQILSENHDRFDRLPDINLFEPLDKFWV